MIPSLRPKLTYSNVIATTALFIALGGAAVAASLPKNSVGPKQLKRGAVTTKALRRAAVTSPKLARKSVIAGKLGPSAVLPGNIVDGGVTTPKIGTNAVIARSIKNGVITTNKLTNEAVTTAKLGKGSVTLAKLADDVAPLLGTLRSGQTLRGVFDLGVDEAGKLARSATSFQFPLGSSPAAPTANVLQPGATSAACPGVAGGGGATPQAAAGQLCVYITEKSANFESLEFGKATNRLGFDLVAKFTAAGADNFVLGQWAVTAP
jgi:hypothetical protein